MKKKIALQTFQLSTNYGGILQAFALQHYLTKKGFDVVHINRAYQSNNSFLKFKIIVDKIINFNTTLAINKAESIFKVFVNKFINLSPPLYSTKLWNKYINENKFDAVIVGSDQIWRQEYVGAFAEEFFLNFKKGKIKKIAYAASFGVDKIGNGYAKQISNQLHDFDAISVREKSGVDILQKNFNIEAVHLIDPTLLLLSQDYIDMFELKKDVKKPYIFAYVLDKNLHKQNMIEEVEKTLGMVSKLVYGSEVTKATYNDVDIRSKVSIETWLSHFYNADYIVTDSFHGMIFSILFNKRFIVIANESRGVSRFESMLNLIDLKEKLIFSGANLKKETILKPIDYESINSIIEEERKLANKFINQVF